MSKGEEQIEYLLKKRRVCYVREKIFPELRGGKLRFDFYLPNLSILIEIDGEQHFKPSAYFYKTRQEFYHAK